MFAVKALTLADATVVGSRALAIVADGDITIAGHVQLIAGSFPSGTCIGGDAELCTGQLQSPVCGGGGGGGFGTPGGDGGDATGSGGMDSAGGTGETSNGTAVLVPLRGGCAGGESNIAQAPGAGGGAVQLVSRTRAVVEASAGQSFLNASGGGGDGTHGGGSGGAIMVEAPKVIVASGTGIVANGAGGGGANDPGDAGRLAVSAAPGGDCVNPYSDGGNGASRAETAAEDGTSITTSATAIAGAGGGGVGRIRVNVPAAIDFSAQGVVSPMPSIGVLATR